MREKFGRGKGMGGRGGGGISVLAATGKRVTGDMAIGLDEACLFLVKYRWIESKRG